jgi:oligogalacturonide lyase
VQSVSRRVVLAAALNLPYFRLFGQSTTKSLPHRGEFTSYVDSLTETVVTRLTSPSSSAVLASPQNRCVSAKDRFLIFSSNRSGVFTPYRLDLKTGVLLQLTETTKLDPKSLTLDTSERNLLFTDGGMLREFSLLSKRVRTLTENISGFTLSNDASQIVVLRQGKAQYPRGVVIASDVSANCFLSPDGQYLLVQRGAQSSVEFWLVPVRSASGRSGEKLLARGRLACPFWSADGQKIIFLREEEIRQVTAQTGTEELVAKTSLFASFSPNRDDSVFVGASRSKAQPTVVLLLRTGRRELTLCEHRATQPAAVSPVFSPDSRRVYFQSDHVGNPAIYSVNIETLVEPTQI